MTRYIALALLVSGAAALIAAVENDGQVTPTHVCLAGAVAAFAAYSWWQHARPRPCAGCEANYDLGYRDGHKVGYDDGRHTRPVVVKLPVEKLCRGNVEPRGRHSARCRDNCEADQQGARRCRVPGDRASSPPSTS